MSWQGIMICVVMYSAAGLFFGGYLTASLFMFHIVVVPLIFKYSKTFRRSLVFANFVQWPLYIDYDEPSRRGINGARNFSIEYQSRVDQCEVKLGVWHILPSSSYSRLKQYLVSSDTDELNRIMAEELAKCTTPIILYCHGNSNSRGATHRIKLYRVFQEMGFHTIAFDYRGYGDSTNVHPTENGVVEDSLIVYAWLLSAVSEDRRPPIYVWGHSLGSGIASHLLGNLHELSTDRLGTPLPAPRGLILESPFNNLADEVAKHPLSTLVTWLPYYERTFVAPFRSAREHTFKSDVYLSRARSLPILILHAKDDVIVPFVVGNQSNNPSINQPLPAYYERTLVAPFRSAREHTFKSDVYLSRARSLPILILHAKDDLIVLFVVGLMLYRTIVESRKDGGATIKLHSYDSKLRLGHKGICDADDLQTVVGEFVTDHQ